MSINDDTHPPSESALLVGLEECVQLLQGPSDERRFVGLLLATKLLPAGDEHVMLAIYNAVGSSFITRLLLPLKSAEGLYSNNENEQRVIAAAGLGLAVLAGLCRVSQLAAAPEVIEKIPLFLKVVRAGGFGPILQRTDGTSEEDVRPSDHAEPADAHAVADALDCLVLVAAASSEGRTVTLQSGGLMAAATALQDGVTGSRQWQAAAVHLLGLLLGGAERSESLAEHPEVAPVAVPALAQLFRGLPGQASAVNQRAQHSPAAGSGMEPASSATDTAALQLEALQVLLLLFPLPLSQAHELQSLAAEAAETDSEGWAEDIRSGVYTVLASRVGQQQRHSALRLTAAVLEMVLPQWLLGSVHTTKMPAPLFQVLVEILKVETSLLLNDTLSLLQPPVTQTPQTPTAGTEQPSPSQPAPQPDQQTFTTPPSSSVANPMQSPDPPVSSARPSAAASTHSVTESVDPSYGNASPSSKEAEPTMPNAAASPSSGDASISTSEPTSSAPPDDNPASVSGAAQPDPSSKQQSYSSNAVVGARVADVLPAVLSLLEVCLEALASAAQDAEEAADQSQQPSCAPVLDDRVAQRAMAALGEAFETVLQFLELVQAEGSPSTQTSPWLLAAIRAYGRFMAEVPGAHAKRVQALLAWLLQCQGGSALPFLLPGLLLCSQPDADSLATDEPGTHKRWRQALTEPQVLTSVMQHVCNTAATATSALQRPEEEALQGAAAELAAATALLQAIVVPEPAAQLSQPMKPETVLVVKPAVQALTQWCAACRQAGAKEAQVDLGLVASAALVCASSLQGSSGSEQATASETWSTMEAAAVFEGVLWALGIQYGYSDSKPQQPVSDALQQLHLQGDKDPQEAGYDDWDAVLEAATTLVESHAVYQKQASDVSWIRQRFELSQNHTSLHLQLFLQACMS